MKIPTLLRPFNFFTKHALNDGSAAVTVVHLGEKQRKKTIILKELTPAATFADFFLFYSQSFETGQKKSYFENWSVENA